jgi:hypothetical protein
MVWYGDPDEVQAIGVFHIAEDPFRNVKQVPLPRLIAKGEI